MASLNALLIGRREESAWCLPRLLSQSGFSVDAITSAPIIHTNKYLNHSTWVPKTTSLIPEAIRHIRQKKYDWILVTDDESLVEIHTSELSPEDKITLLPIVEEENLKHIYSKINLSHLMLAHGIQTPPFTVAYDLETAKQGAEKLGYPVFVKIDASSGGFGTFECRNEKELCALEIGTFKVRQKNHAPDKSNHFPPLLMDLDPLCQKDFHFAEAAVDLIAPVLIQKKIMGVELDTSAIFHQKQLIHFSCSKVESSVKPLGPSLLRTYRQLTTNDQTLQDELQRFGNALGADGIVTIGCIEAADGSGRYYFEADMRPNAWVEYSCFIGDSPIRKIKKWFKEKKTVPLTELYSSRHPQTCTIPYFLRMPFNEILTNKYHVWRYIPPGGWGMLKSLFESEVKKFFKPSIAWRCKRILYLAYRAAFRCVGYANRKLNS